MFECIDDHDCGDGWYCNHNNYECTQTEAVCDNHIDCKSFYCSDAGTCSSCGGGRRRLQEGGSFEEEMLYSSFDMPMNDLYGDEDSGLSEEQQYIYGGCAYTCESDDNCSTPFRDEWLTVYCLDSQCQTNKSCSDHSHCSKTNFCNSVTGNCDRCVADADCDNLDGTNSNNYYCMYGQCTEKNCPGTGNLHDVPEDDYELLESAKNCSGDSEQLNDNVSIDECYELCYEIADCFYFSVGADDTSNEGECWWEKTTTACEAEGFTDDPLYDFYQIKLVYHGNDSNRFAESPTYAYLDDPDSKDTYNVVEYCSNAKKFYMGNIDGSDQPYQREKTIRYECKGHKVHTNYHEECTLTNYCNSNTGKCDNCSSNTDCGSGVPCNNGICGEYCETWRDCDQSSGINYCVDGDCTPNLSCFDSYDCLETGYCADTGWCTDCNPDSQNCSGVIFLASPGTVCSETTSLGRDDCETVALELVDEISALTWEGEVDKDNRPPGCFMEYSAAKFEYNTDDTSTDENTRYGGLCRYPSESTSSCTDDSSCESDNYCQLIQAYIGPGGSHCVDEDLITVESLCQEAAAEQSGNFVNSESRSDRPYGCFAIGSQYWLNTNTNGQNTADNFEYVHPICRKTTTDGTCQTASCGSDSNCDSVDDSSGLKVDLYCEYYKCRTKQCTQHSDCSKTNYCDSSHGLCALCDLTADPGECDSGARCQDGSYYFTNFDSSCTSTDLISDDTTCSEAAAQNGLSYSQEVENSDRQKGCILSSTDYKLYFNSYDSDTSLDSFAPLCYSTTGMCLSEFCTIDAECKSILVASEATQDLYCIEGQCRTKSCNNPVTDCPDTKYCDASTGLCSFCDNTQSSSQCETGFVCSADFKCIEACSEATEETDCSSHNFAEHCHEELCTTSKPCTANTDCGRTNFCLNNVCDVCPSDIHSCDVGATCQEQGTTYFGDWGTNCQASDLIMEETHCQTATTENGLAWSSTQSYEELQSGCVIWNGDGSLVTLNSFVEGATRQENSPICQSRQGACLADTCSQDSECTELGKNGLNQIDLYCLEGQCRTKTCNSHSDCVNTSYCGSSQVCAYCLDGDQCETGSTCQTLNAYVTQEEYTTCTSSDEITDADLCWKAGSQIGTLLEFSEFQHSEWKYGCTKGVGNNWQFNSDITLSEHHTDDRRSICNNQLALNKCVADQCQQNSDCSSVTESDGRQIENQCSNGQCLTTACSSSSDCTNTNFCDPFYSVCSFCDETFPCEDGYSCQISHYLGLAASSCTENDIITDEATCLAAISELGYTYQTTVAEDFRPYGCFSMPNNNGAWFNTDVDGINSKSDGSHEFVHSICKIPSASSSGCVENTCSSDDQCNSLYVTDGHTVDFYCQSGQCRQKTCSINSECAKSHFCNASTSLCSQCEDGDFCGSGHTCQTKQFYVTPIDGECIETDLITDANLCYDAGVQLAFAGAFEQINKSDRPYGCIKYNGDAQNWRFNTDTDAINDVEAYDSSQTCSKQNLYGQCLENSCSEDADCGNSESNGIMIEQQCSLNSCITRSCEIDSDCPNSNFCDPLYGVCTFCTSDEQCQTGYSCNDQLCIPDFCNEENEETACSQTDLTEHCFQGQCSSSKPCSANSDCGRTSFCSNSGKCTLCDPDLNACDVGSTCQPRDNTCWIDICEVDDHFTCEQGLFWHCELGQCYERNCYDTDIDCPKIYPPIWFQEEPYMTLTRNEGWSLDIYDLIQDDPNGDDFDTYEININLGQATYFIEQDDGVLEQKYFDSAEEYNFQQVLTPQTQITVEITNQYEQSTTGIIQLDFLTEIIAEENSEEVEQQDEVAPGCRRRLKKSKRTLDETQDDQESTEEGFEAANEGDQSDLPECPDEEEETKDSQNSDSSSDSSSQTNSQTENGSTETSEQSDFDQSNTSGFEGIDVQEVDSQYANKEEIKPLRKKITMNERGILTISFSKEMNFPANFVDMILSGKQSNNARNLSEEIIAVKVIGAKEQASKNLELEWDIVCEQTTILFEGEIVPGPCVLSSQKEIQIQLNFKKALEISQSGEPDQVQIHFKAAGFFKDPDADLLNNHEIITDLKFNIPGQMPLECVACDRMIETAAVTEEATTAAVTSSFIISMLVGMAKNVLFSMINMMQMYVYLPLLDITFPGNIRMFLQFFMGLASCDLIMDETIWKSVFHFEPALGLEPYNDNFEALGFETSSILYNFGDLAIIQFYVLGLLILLASSKACKKTEKVNQFSRSLFFNFPLRFYISAFMEIALGSLIKYYSQSYSFATNSDAADSVFSYFYLGALLVVPFLLLTLVLCKHKTIQLEGSFYKRFNEMFAVTHLKTLFAMNYTLIFLLRRMLLVYSIFYLQDENAIFQVYLLVFNFLMYLVYLMNVKPFKEDKNLKMEIITECCLLCFSYIVMCFTFFVHDAETRFTAGWGGIFVSSFNLLVNLFIIFADIFRTLKLGAKKAKLRICNHAKKSNYCKAIDCFGLIKRHEPIFVKINGKQIQVSPRTFAKIDQKNKQQQKAVQKYVVKKDSKAKKSQSKNDVSKILTRPEREKQELFNPFDTLVDFNHDEEQEEIKQQISLKNERKDSLLIQPEVEPVEKEMVFHNPDGTTTTDYLEHQKVIQKMIARDRKLREKQEKIEESKRKAKAKTQITRVMTQREIQEENDRLDAEEVKVARQNQEIMSKIVYVPKPEPKKVMQNVELQQYEVKDFMELATFPGLEPLEPIRKKGVYYPGMSYKEIYRTFSDSD